MDNKNQNSKNRKFGTIVATGGTNTEIHLWRLNNNNNNTAESSNILQHKCLLTRMDRSVNALAFSPNGLYLAAAGDGGNVVVYSVPREKRGGGNGQHYWSEVSKEADLLYRIIPTQTEDIFDVAWSPDSKRFCICSLDHSIAVIELLDHHHPTSSLSTNAILSSSLSDTTNIVTQNKAEAQESSSSVAMSESSTTSSAATHTTVPSSLSTSTTETAEKWSIISRHKDHTHYVQGIAYDPKGVYIASQASDRTVRILSRKPPKQRGQPLLQLKFEVESKQQVIKYRETSNDVQKGGGLKEAEMNVVQSCSKNEASDANTASTATATAQANHKQLKRYLFCDESLESFFRRLSWTPDGAFLIAPSGLWSRGVDAQQQSSVQTQMQEGRDSNNTIATSSTTTTPSYSTLLFARHRFDEGPVAVLSGHAKPSVVVRPCPTLFQLPKISKNDTAIDKENPNATTAAVQIQMSTKLKHRTIFCVLTIDTVYIYDTVQLAPLAVVQGIHYAGLTDAAWSNDGRTLIVTSSDGYLTVLSFEEGELGDVVNDNHDDSLQQQIETEMDQLRKSSVEVEQVRLPPCSAGESIVVEVPPAKRVKMAETPVSSVLFIDKDAPPSVCSIGGSAARLDLVAEQDCADDEARGNKRALDAPLNDNTILDDENAKPETTKEVMKKVNDLSLDKNSGVQAQAGPKKKRIRPQLINTTI
eukprot:CAMPEP_0116016952 /NCGR_PEP_ID=MMETSP0321-20121206/7772_1 /TAXON_ID=163516 /ORGANISM="Leptocylindrus danicus var. danicus, Strain B650" /LENGTH=699 /DNA_ID=CAMNT_0003487079 /DNA_START=296 /DNA_END=2395 /DNA_ORIENTATION=-